MFLCLLKVFNNYIIRQIANAINRRVSAPQRRLCYNLLNRFEQRNCHADAIILPVLGALAHGAQLFDALACCAARGAVVLWQARRLRKAFKRCAP
jgi:hypothetical protein